MYYGQLVGKELGVDLDLGVSGQVSKRDGAALVLGAVDLGIQRICRIS